MFDLHGKTALVTGASSGLGVEFAHALASQGADVALLARRVDKLNEVRASVEKLGVRGLAVKCDVLDRGSIKAAISEVKEQFGRIDILVNNAGVGAGAPAEAQPDEVWLNVINTNLNAVYFVAHEVGKIMVEQKYGKIINIGSIHSNVAMKDLPISGYCAAKGGVFMLTKNLAAEWAKYNITVNAIGPSYFDTEMTHEILKEPAVIRAVKEFCPMGRVGKPEELDGALIYFASDESSFTTGQLLSVDGGWTAI